MKPLRRLAILSGFFTALVGFSQDYDAFIKSARGHHQAKEYPQAIDDFRTAFKLESARRPDLYNAACSAAMAGDAPAALAWLKQAVAQGFSAISHLNSDRDLVSLHETNEWKEIVAQTQKQHETVDEPLRIALLAIYEEDQKYRQQMRSVEAKSGRDSAEMKALWQTMREKDEANLVKVKAILDQNGWVGPDRIGPQANSTLFLVIQHSNLQTQQHYLPLMRAAVKAHDASGSSLALLEDRVALGEGHRQTYGSQIGRDQKSGKYYVLPLDDPDHVDQRRRDVGLPPLAEYVKRWDITWDVEDYKKALPALEAKE